jgi:hypothetical protein
MKNILTGWAMQVYKVIEICPVTEDSIEEALNIWSSHGWQFDGLQFAMHESSKRPTMAFAFFTQGKHRAGINCHEY